MNTPTRFAAACARRRSTLESRLVRAAGNPGQMAGALHDYMRGSLAALGKVGNGRAERLASDLVTAITETVEKHQDQNRRST
jgi:hypothetical protein